MSAIFFFFKKKIKSQGNNGKKKKTEVKYFKNERKLLSKFLNVYDLKERGK